MAKKRIFVFLLFFLTIFGIVKTHYYLTKGFRLQKVIYQHPSEEAQTENQISSHFQMPYHYIGKGRQVYVFASSDEKYVIKLIRDHKYRTPLWAKYFSCFHLLNASHKQMLLEQEERYERAIQSYAIAKNELSQEVNLCFFHFGKTVECINTKLFLFDHLHRKMEIDLDDVAFCIQKKAVPIKEVLLSLKKQKDHQKAQWIIEKTLDKIFSRINREILNRDLSNILTNFGYDGEDVFEMDIGSFYKEKDLLSYRRKVMELQQFVQPLEVFVKKHFPQLTYVLDDKILSLMQNWKKDERQN